MRIFASLLGTLLIASICATAVAAEGAGRSAVTTDPIWLAAVGDVMVHQSVKYTARDRSEKDSDGEPTNRFGWNFLFEEVADILHAADISFANVETPVLSPPANDPWFIQSGRFPLFKAPPALIDSLKWASFRVLSVANNHSPDQGVPGILSTLGAVRSAGLATVGAGENRDVAYAPAMVRARGSTVGVLGATCFVNTHTSSRPDVPQVAILSEDSLPAWQDRVRKLRERTDLVVLTVHWGEEEMTTPRDREVRLAHRLCDAGVDVILGHHPHVLQPLEVYATPDGRRSLIAYSLGNFITGNPKRSWRTGAILLVKVARETIDGRLAVTGYGYEPTWTQARPAGTRVLSGGRMVRDAQIALGAGGPAPHDAPHWKALRSQGLTTIADSQRALGPSWVDLPKISRPTAAPSPAPSPIPTPAPRMP